MKTPTGVLGIVVVIALASPASASHVCPFQGCFPRGYSLQSSDDSPSVNVQAATEAATGRWFTGVVRRIRLAIVDASSIVKDWVGADGVLNSPSDAVKKKASRMGLRKSKRYMKSLGRA
jgi:hypothetical protein